MGQFVQDRGRSEDVLGVHGFCWTLPIVILAFGDVIGTLSQMRVNASAPPSPGVGLLSIGD